MTVQSLEAQHGYIINGITAANYFSSSDRALKTDIQDASLQSCQEVFDAVHVKTYARTDLAPGKRIGFIAQDVQGSLPRTGEFANLVGTRPDGELLTLDYSRLVCVLWGVVKNLTSRLEALEANLP
ncbi:MAG: tail fiber domain-containing protein [Porticoccaceae bacterium]